jgi:hypothetical protein
MSQDQPPKDHVDGDEGAYDDAPSLEDNLKSRATWLRLLFMVILILLFVLGVIVGCFAVVFQFFWVLFTGETKRELVTVGRQLAEYFKEIVLYLSFNTDERPFPFDRDWPSV